MKEYIILISILVLLIGSVEARSGCCSHHGGVCGCKCCDGTSLSAKCAPYYPSCNKAPEPVVETCNNECNYEGQTTCEGESSYKTCGNYDRDNCLEWNNAKYCGYDYECFQGECKKKVEPEPIKEKEEQNKKIETQEEPKKTIKEEKFNQPSKPENSLFLKLIYWIKTWI